MIMTFEITLISAGILNSSDACRIPTKEYAIPVRHRVGSIILVRDAHNSAVSALNFGAKSSTSCSENNMPAAVMRSVSTPMTVTKLPANLCASLIDPFSPGIPYRRE